MIIKNHNYKHILAPLLVVFFLCFYGLCSILPAAGTNTLGTISTNIITNTSTNARSQIDPALQKIIDLDNETQAETDKWIQDYNKLNTTNEVTDATLPLRILDRLDTVQQAYEEYLFTHADSLEGRLAYASFLADSGKDNDAAREWMKLRDQYPNNPVLWNNMGNYFGQKGDAANAFPNYEKAIELAPKEPLYTKNLALVIYIFRQEAMDYYHLNEQQTVLLAQALFQRTAQIASNDFVLATLLAQTWYNIQPFQAAKARKDWEKAYALASDDAERQGVQIHYARVAMLDNDLDTAEKELAQVTFSGHQESKTELLAEIQQRKKSVAEKTTE